jgi:hypothetical protein
MSTNRAALFSKIYKVLKKHYKPITPLAERSLLEHLLYAFCLENSRYEMADEAFAKLQLYADWNEVRVTTVTELSEVMSMLPQAADAARHLKQTLQTIFETRYSFDLDYLKKMNLGKAIKELEGLRGITAFAVAYTGQHGLGGHVIPANRGVYDAFVALGAISESEAVSERIPGLERAIAKAKGLEFASLVHQLGVDVLAVPHPPKLKGILQEINPDVSLVRREKKTAPTKGERRREAAKRAARAKLEEEKKKLLAKKEPAAEAPRMKEKAAKTTTKAAGKPITKKKPK